MRRFFRPYNPVIVAAVASVLLSGAIRRSGQTGPTPYPLSYPAYFGNRVNIPDDNPLTVEGVALGRRLFYDRRLSANNTLSCGSCHQQAHAFADVRSFSLGFDGTPTRRNAMSLCNLLWVRHFFWDGRAGSLEEQAVTPAGRARTFVVVRLSLWLGYHHGEPRRQGDCTIRAGVDLRPVPL